MSCFHATLQTKAEVEKFSVEETFDPFDAARKTNPDAAG